MVITIREARAADAGAAVETLRRSITELCLPDHLGDAQEIADWLANKTVESWQAWVARGDAAVLVALRGGDVVGVGMVTLAGEVLLNYVHPKARFVGVSTALLGAMEARLRAGDVQTCYLTSTLTAQGFYESCGYRGVGLDLAKAL
jgi:N-acetylglutamate synthase-like GNAT family acetyltransferase